MVKSAWAEQLRGGFVAAWLAVSSLDSCEPGTGMVVEAAQHEAEEGLQVSAYEFGGLDRGNLAAAMRYPRGTRSGALLRQPSARWPTSVGAPGWPLKVRMPPLVNFANCRLSLPFRVMPHLKH
jgi:hypothetical protein